MPEANDHAGSRSDSDEREAPFRIGDRVTQRGCEHFGVLTVTDVEWIVRTAPGIAPYWLVTAAQDQTPQQDHPPGACGIVVAGDTRASADRFTLAAGFTRRAHQHDGDGERVALTEDYDRHHAEHHHREQALERERDEARAERDAFKRDKMQLCDERAEVERQRDEAISEREKALAKASIADRRRDTVECYVCFGNGATTFNNGHTAKCRACDGDGRLNVDAVRELVEDQYRAHKDTIALVQANATEALANNEKIKAGYAALRAERDALAARLAEIKREWESACERERTSEWLRKEAEKERDALAAERDAFHMRYRSQCDVETKAAIARAEAMERANEAKVKAWREAEARAEAAEAKLAMDEAATQMIAADRDHAEKRATALAEALDRIERETPNGGCGCCINARDIARTALAANATTPAGEKSLPILTLCPDCHRQHVDKDDWTTRPHKTHRCEHCGREWRPMNVATVGVLMLPAPPNAGEKE